MPRKSAAASAARARSSESPRKSRPKIGLALAGGGPLGGIYEIGALLALADSLDGLDLNDLDAYVGVSSGGFVAAALANGISPAQMYRLFIDEGADAALKPEIFLRPALGEFRRRASALPALGWRVLRQYVRNPFRPGMMASFATLTRAMPTGVFDNRAIDAFLAKLFAAPAKRRGSDNARRANSPSAGRRNNAGDSAASAPSSMNSRYICAGEMSLASAAATKPPDDTPT